MYLKLSSPDSAGTKTPEIMTQDAFYIAIQEETDSLASYLKRNNSQNVQSLKSCEIITSDISKIIAENSESIFLNKTNETFIFIIIVAFLSVLIAVFISRQIIFPFNSLLNTVEHITKGELPESINITTSDEIGDIARSIDTLVAGLRKTAEFSIEIGKGNFESDFKPLGTNDILGNSLLAMRDSLKVAFSEEEKRKIEDAQRNRTSEGLTLFAEILRHHTENIRELSNEIISNLVKFLNANQGGIFILNDSDKKNIRLELLGAYAYNRKKYLNKSVKPGEGLIGAVALEKYTIHLTEIPDEYIEIESGTGSANPKSLIIVPLKIENNILGVLELASFNNFEKYEIDLVEKIAESIASTLSTARINTRTAELLEQSNKQAARMREQEDEMLRNLTAVKSSLEEAEKREHILKDTLQNMEKSIKLADERERDFEKEVSYLNNENKDKVKKILEDEVFIKNLIDSDTNSLIVADDDLKIKFFNKTAQNFFGYNFTEIIGRNLSIIFPEDFVKKYTNKTGDFVLKNTDIAGHIIEIPILKKDKTKQNVQFSLTYTGGENKLQYIVFIKDISKEEYLERERVSIMESLMAKEFEYEIKIERLERALSEANVQIPEDSDTSEIIKWGSLYSINLNLIDQQHKKWIDIINNFYKEFKKGAALQEIQKYFKELLDYSDYHFSFEEKYMVDFKYEDFEDHKQKHADFLQKIRSYQVEFEEGKQDVAYRLMGFLRKWVRLHISEDDFSYSALFRKNGLT
jgi:hemerythrin-like metal-binding protein/PAS domain S-box-containing protein